jgi:hypothetical protein
LLRRFEDALFLQVRLDVFVIGLGHCLNLDAINHSSQAQRKVG